MNEFLDYTLIHIGNFNLKVISLLKLVFAYIVIIILLRLIRKAIYNSHRVDIAKKATIYSLIRYFTLVFTIVIALQILGLNLSILIAGSAALLVGVGLGLQNLFSDFVSGIILLVDSSIKVNDVIDINGLVCQVQNINFRTTTVLTRDDKYIIVPNSHLTQNQIINWTHSETTSRFEITVGVDYSSDVNLVMTILKEAALNHHDVLKSPEPFVRFTDYADSSLNFCLFFWSDHVFRVENIKSDIRVDIYDRFRQNNVTIPFPQRVVHFHDETKK